MRIKLPSLKVYYVREVGKLVFGTLTKVTDVKILSESSKGMRVDETLRNVLS